MENVKCKFVIRCSLFIIFLTGTLVLWYSLALFADVIYDEGKEALVKDKRALRIGDLITIIVTESAAATNRASTETSKEFSTKTPGGSGWLDFISDWGISSEEKFGGSGTTKRSGSFTTRLTARIVDVLPNGNYKIEATRVLVINEEKQQIVLSGIIRPEDITSDNTIYSTYISDARIEYRGKGAITRKQKYGILGKLFDWLF